MVKCCTAFLFKARPSQLAVADGEYKTRPEPFLDLLLEQQVVRENPDSLLSSLLLVAIKDGKSSVLTVSAQFSDLCCFEAIGLGIYSLRH